MEWRCFLWMVGLKQVIVPRETNERPNNLLLSLMRGKAAFTCICSQSNYKESVYQSCQYDPRMCNNISRGSSLFGGCVYHNTRSIRLLHRSTKLLILGMFVLYDLIVCCCSYILCQNLFKMVLYSETKGVGVTGTSVKWQMLTD